MSGTIPKQPSSPEILRTFVSRLHRRILTSLAYSASKPYEDHCWGAILFVDILGFTGLTEQFATHGPVGAEELCEVLNGYYERITSLVIKEGGDVLAFAGDAVLGLWVAETESQLSHATLLCCQAALQVRDKIQVSAISGTHLPQRVLVACGRFKMLDIGDTVHGRHFVVAGAALADIGQLSHQVTAGDIAVLPSAWKLICEQGRATQRADFFILQCLINKVAPLADDPELPTSDSLLEPYIFPPVLERIHSDYVRWLAEFRRISVLFIRFSGDGVEELARFSAAVGATQAILMKFEGCIYQVIMDDKGFVVIGAFGLPGLAHEDDGKRAVDAALSINEEISQLSLRCSIGVAAGLSFCGVVGGPKRRQYVAVGSVMNIAARLMQAPSCRILCHETVFQALRTKPKWKFVRCQDVSLTGESQPIHAYAPYRGADERSYEPLGLFAGSVLDLHKGIVGRLAEQTVFADALQQLVTHGRGTNIILEGEAGIGKSCLANSFLQHGLRAGVQCLIGVGDSIERSNPYYPWRAVFTKLLGLEGVQTQSEIERHLASQLRSEPELANLIPLLAPVLSVPLEDNVITSQMASESKAENTQRYLLQLLRKAASRAPHLLLIDDAHLLDSASLSLAAAVGHSSVPLLLIISARSFKVPPPNSYRQLSSAPNTHSLRLDTLSRDESLEIACRCLKVDSLPPAVANFLESRASGQPLFIQELAHALREAGVIRVAGRTCTLAFEEKPGTSLQESFAQAKIPNTLEGVINSRLDHVSPEHQLLCKVASIIGAHFTFPMLQEIYPVETDRELLLNGLAVLDELGLVKSASLSEEAYAFRHAVIQEITYNSISFSRRKELHAAVGEWYERANYETPSHYPRLAHHFHKAGILSKALYYSSKAGDIALDNYASQEAVYYFEQALQAGQQIPKECSQDQLAHLHLQLGKAYTEWSRYIEARMHLEEGLALQGHPIPQSAVKTSLHLMSEVTRQLTHRLMPRVFVGRQGEHRDPLLGWARVFEALMEIYYLQDQTVHCLLALFRYLNFAELAGPSPELARGYASAGSLVGFIPLHSTANFYFQRAEEVCSKVQDLSVQGWLALARSLYSAGLGDWETASFLVSQAIKIADAHGSRRRGDDARLTLATLQHLQGAFDESLITCELLYKSAQERQDLRCQAEALRIRAYSLLALQSMHALPECLKALDRLRSTQVHAGGVHKKHDVYVLYAVFHLWHGEHDLAIQAANKALEILTATSNSFFDYILEWSNLTDVYLQLFVMEHPKAAAMKKRVRRICRALNHFSRVFPIGRPLSLSCSAEFAWVLGQRRKARGLWTQALAFARDRQLSYQQVLVLQAMGRQLGLNHPEGAALLREARQILEDIKTRFTNNSA